MTAVQDTVADALRSAVERERSSGLAKSWRSPTKLINAFDLQAMSPQTCQQIIDRLSASGLAVLPSDPAEWERASKVRLLLPTDDPSTPQDLVKDGLVTVRRWLPGQEPAEVSLASLKRGLGKGCVWIDIAPSAEVHTVVDQLSALLPGLTDEAIQDVLEVDDLPSAASYGEVRKVSTVVVRADEDETRSESKSGLLVFQIVELLVGSNWMISVWHEPRSTPTDSGHLSMADEKQLAISAVTECWVRSDHTSVGELGLLLFRELARSYTSARRTLYSWLEQWELAFHKSPKGIEQLTLRDLRMLVSEFQQRLNGLNEARVEVAEHSWFPHTSTSDLDQQLDAILDRSIEGLVALSGEVRSSVDLLTTAGIREHLRLAEESSRKADRLQDQVGLVASILLVPTFIAGLFGANTEVPGQGHWSGFVGMLALMIAGSFGTWAFFQRIKRQNHEDEEST